MKYDFFISYRRSDREIVANVVRKLEERGASVWYDAEIEGGADWREIIVEALTNSDMLVIFFSEACNSSRQLKKELAVADNMEKPVIPILIENTKPKGAYLYELADRNWLQAFPDPLSHVKDIVDHLIGLAEKSPGGLGGTPSESLAMSKSSSAPSDAPAAPPPEPAVEGFGQTEEAPRAKQAAPVLGDLFKSAPAQSVGPRAEDYIGKKTKLSAKTQNLNDILPFKWIDLVFLIPLIGLVAWGLEVTGMNAGDDSLVSDLVAHFMFALTVVALYGALVFPFRYYMRRRRPISALAKYVISSVILYGVVMATFVVGYLMGLFPYDEPADIALVFGGIWLGFAVVAFTLYGILAAQRAVRSFRANIKQV